MRKKKNKNLLDLKPVRKVKWLESDGKVVLIVPKFKISFIQRLFEKLFSSSHFKVKLDEYGSVVWKMCDGSYTVMDIVQALDERFGGSIENLLEKTVEFLRQLAMGKFIEFIE